jgi:hypothetical protein
VNRDIVEKRNQHGVSEDGTHGVLTIIRRNGDEWMILHDLKDQSLVQRYCWRIVTAMSAKFVGTGTATEVQYLHRLIMNAGPDEDVAFVGEDMLDLRRSNLRVMKHADLLKHKAKSFGYTCWSPDDHAWLSYRHLKGKNIFVGRFPSREAAVKAWDESSEPKTKKRTGKKTK